MPPVLVFVTVAIHSAVDLVVLGVADSVTPGPRARRHRLSDATVIAALVLFMAIAAVIESAVWAGVYFGVGAIPDFETALYFSLVIFTTLGYGDITLSEEWRLLGGFQAANGIIIFGWTTGLLVAVIQRLATRKSSQKAPEFSSLDNRSHGGSWKAPAAIERPTG